MAMDNGPLIAAAELQRKLQIHDEQMQSYRAQKWARWKQLFFQSARKALFFLFGAAMVVFAITHRKEIDSLVRQKTDRALAHVQTKSATADALRQSTLNYEKEVDEASK
jgi:hypothetical protein